jgi:hypothetical protein
MKPYRFFQENRYKKQCRLEVGSSFIFRGDYCVVEKMLSHSFQYRNQNYPHITFHMDYGYYLTTPSAAGRKLTKDVTIKYVEWQAERMV